MQSRRQNDAVVSVAFSRSQTRRQRRHKNMSSVKGVIFDESVLLLSAAPNANDSAFRLRSGAYSLLRKLRQSKIRTGVSYGLGLSSDKVIALKRIATEYLCDCFLLDASIDGAVNEINEAWGDNEGSILYVVSENKDAVHKLSSHWLIIVVGEYC
ncbi:hypothetical protein Pint_26381 [Pistacia integerrima]|uniref:Uncharacterized protein n=1 Tax=Pistacia integerrima TaxID=434235 RepID=A0ACC0YE00_9ROSI|nr:hypothetical protein Pint_26381 [Pistacia integerrima]